MYSISVSIDLNRSEKTFTNLILMRLIILRSKGQAESLKHSHGLSSSEVEI